MMDKELIDKLLVGIRGELEKAKACSCCFEAGVQETTQPGAAWATFEHTDQMTITIKINEPS